MSKTALTAIPNSINKKAMRYSIILLIALSLLVGCESRSCCECEDDIQFIWSEDNQLTNVDIHLPNAVLNTGEPFTMSIGKFGQMTFPSEIEWKLRSIKVSKDEEVFENTTSTSAYVKDSRLIEIPHDVFDSSEGLISGAISIDLDIFFPEENASVNIVGSVYYYTCDDLEGDFEAKECRWPNQIIGTHTHGLPSPC